MSKRSQGKLSQQGDSPTGWGIAIAEAEKRIEKLRLSIDTFKEYQANGEPWPGEKKLPQRAKGKRAA